jgi:RNA polymerase sigma factor (sigma-70 family)
MSLEKEQQSTSAADDAALRADGNQLADSTNGNGHPAEQDCGDAGRVPPPGRPAGEAVQAVQERVRCCWGVAERLARRQYRCCEGRVPLEELGGEAQRALLEAAGRYDPGRGVPLEAYVVLIIGRRLKRAVLLWRRWSRPHPLSFTDLDGPAGGPFGPASDPPCTRTPGPDRAAAVRETLERVRRVLPEQWFAVLWLHFVQGYSKEEIGRQLGVTRQWVQQLIRKAVERARRHCPGECDLW